MANDILVRAYRETDWPELNRIHDAARLDELRASAGDAAFLTLEQTHENEGLFDGRIAVAEIDGRTSGFAAWTKDALTWLYVAPSDYRRGIGRALLHHVLADSQPGFTTEVLEGNVAALSLYLSAGFVIVERREGRLEGNEAFAATGFLLVWNG